MTVEVETDHLQIVMPAEDEIFWGFENTIFSEKYVPISVKAIGPASQPAISLTLSSIIPPIPSSDPGPSFESSNGNPATGLFLWTPQIGSAGAYAVTFTAADGVETVSRSCTVNVDPYAPDRDGDGIPDTVDLDPDNFSNDFMMKNGIGTIESRGDQDVKVDALDDGRVLIWALPGGGVTPAVIRGCKDTAILRLSSDQHGKIWCGSAGVKALKGSIDVEFLDVLGQHAYTILDPGNSVVFDPSNYSFTAGESNMGVVTMTVNSIDYVISPGEVLVLRKDDFVGTWDGQGVYYRSSESSAWTMLASPATLLAVGDLDGGGLDDLVGIWPSQGGVWVRSQEKGVWTKLASTARAIAAGDMNGDGRVDLLGTWDGQGVYYRDSMTSSWIKLASPAELITTGDLDGDGLDDLIGIWPSQGGVWVRYSEGGTWVRLASTARDIAVGDMNGDGRDDLLATWEGQGVFYRDSVTGAWVKLASEADQVTCGDVDGDLKADLIGVWPAQAGVWVKYSKTETWARLSTTPRDISAGKVRAVGLPGSTALMELLLPAGGIEAGPEGGIGWLDLSHRGPGGMMFSVREAGGGGSGPSGVDRRAVLPGPGEPGFVCEEQKNLYPGEIQRNIKPGGAEKRK